MPGSRREAGTGCCDWWSERATVSPWTRHARNASSPQRIFLSEGCETSTLTTDPAASTTKPLVAASGISGGATKVGRLNIKTALFTFPYPAGTDEPGFSSVWINVWMMNAASRVRRIPDPRTSELSRCHPASPFEPTNTLSSRALLRMCRCQFTHAAEDEVA